MNVGFTELLAILIIVVIFFGPSRLPSLGKSLGEAIRGFKDAMNEGEKPGAAQKPQPQNQAHTQAQAPSPSADSTQSGTVSDLTSEKKKDHA